MNIQKLTKPGAYERQVSFLRQERQGRGLCPGDRAGQTVKGSLASFCRTRQGPAKGTPQCSSAPILRRLGIFGSRRKYHTVDAVSPDFPRYGAGIPAVSRAIWRCGDPGLPEGRWPFQQAPCQSVSPCPSPCAAAGAPDGDVTQKAALRGIGEAARRSVHAHSGVLGERLSGAGTDAFRQTGHSRILRISALASSFFSTFP